MNSTPSKPTLGDWFGAFTDLEGDLLAVTAATRDGSATDTGQVYVYQFHNGTFTEVSKLTKQSEAAGDVFGRDVDLNDGQLAISIKNHDNGGTLDVGGYAVVDLRPSVKDSVQYLHADHLDSPVAATDVFGNVVGTQSFFPFGEVRTGTGIFDTERGFTGQIFDAGTGLGFYNARYYDTALGKFISPDSLIPNPANPGLFNRFAYVSNNPLRYTDPTGFACSEGAAGQSIEDSPGECGLATDEAVGEDLDDRTPGWSDPLGPPENVDWNSPEGLNDLAAYYWTPDAVTLISRETSVQVGVGFGEGDFLIIFPDGTYIVGTFFNSKFSFTGISFKTAGNIDVSYVNVASPDSDIGAFGVLAWSNAFLGDFSWDPSGITRGFEYELPAILAVADAFRKLDRSSWSKAGRSLLKSFRGAWIPTWDIDVTQIDSANNVINMR